MLANDKNRWVPFYFAWWKYFEQAYLTCISTYIDGMRNQIKPICASLLIEFISEHGLSQLWASFLLDDKHNGWRLEPGAAVVINCWKTKVKMYWNEKFINILTFTHFLKLKWVK